MSVTLLSCGTWAASLDGNWSWKHRKFCISPFNTLPWDSTLRHHSWRTDVVFLHLLTQSDKVFWPGDRTLAPWYCLGMRLGPKAKSLYISPSHSLGKQLKNVYTLQTECTTPTRNHNPVQLHGKFLGHKIWHASQRPCLCTDPPGICHNFRSRLKKEKNKR